MAPEILETTCCVVGGGPAGMMLDIFWLEGEFESRCSKARGFLS